MSDSPLSSNAQPVDEWLNSISSLDAAAALAFLQASALANDATLEKLAIVALDEIEQDAALAGRRLAVAALLRQYLVADSDEQSRNEQSSDEQDTAIPAAVDAQLAYAQARLHVQQGRLRSAAETLREAQSHWQRANDANGLARSFLGLTQIFAMQGAYDEAEIAARQAVAIFSTTTNDAASTLTPDELPFTQRLQWAGAQHNLATLFLYTERHEMALTEYDRALALLLAVDPASLDAANALRRLSEVGHNELNRATALTFLDAPDEAEAALLRAAQAFFSADEVMNHGRTQTNLGRLYLRMGRYAEALAAFDRATNDLLGDRSAELLLASPNPANTSDSSGESNVDELDRLRQADELLLEQAMAYLVMNLLPEAQQRLAHCESLFRSAEQPYELGQTLYTSGLARLRLRDFPTATTKLVEAANQFTQLNNYYWLNRTTLAQAALLYAQGKADDAIATLLPLITAVSGLNESDTVDALAWDVGGLIELYLLRFRLAIVLNEEAETGQWAVRIADLLGLSFVALEQDAAATDTVATPVDMPERVALPHYTQQFYHLMGRWALQQGLPLQARYYFQRAIAILENTRSYLPVEEIRTAYLDDKSELYADLVLLLLAQAESDPTAIADAFAAVERARSRALLERLLVAMDDDEANRDESERDESNSEGDSSGPSREADESQATMLRNRLHWLYNQLLGESGSRRLNATLTTQLLAEEANLKRLEWRQSALLRQAEPTDLTSFQAALAADQQAIVYVILHASTEKRIATQDNEAGLEVMAFLVEKDAITPYRHLTTTAMLTPLLDELRFQLGRAELGSEFLARHAERLELRLHNVLGDLYNLLMAPLRKALTCQRLLIVPFGPLHRLPFHALWDGKSYLLEWASVSYAPSASTVVLRQQMSNRKSISFDAQQTRWAGIAVHDPAIPAACDEVIGAARCFAHSKVFLEEQAGREGLAQAAQADILHLATHGLFRPDNPFFSALKLADGWMNVRDLYGLSLHAQLVVLSACESGAGAIRGGDEVVGLVRGFLGAGAHTVLASLWNVHDSTAVAFMRHFYLALTTKRFVLPADALRAAQRWAIAQKLHPYYWAPFYVIGE